MRLLAITPPAAIAARLDVGLVSIWLENGADARDLAVLLREPGRGAGAILADPRFIGLRGALAEAGVPALVSVDPHAPDPEGLAEALRRASPAIAGVQLRGDPSPDTCAQWRARLPGLVLGRSVHGLAPIHADVDYTCLAPIHTPQTAQAGVSKRAIGLEGLRRWTAARGDVLALGGITADNASDCLDAGARGLAAIRLLFGPREQTAENVASVRRALARARAGADDHGAPAQARGRGAPPGT